EDDERQQRCEPPPHDFAVPGRVRAGAWAATVVGLLAPAASRQTPIAIRPSENHCASVRPAMMGLTRTNSTAKRAAPPRMKYSQRRVPGGIGRFRIDQRKAKIEKYMIIS